MTLFCTGKRNTGTPCGHVVDRPNHKKGWLVIACVKCGNSTDHCPQPDKAPGTWLPRKPFGHAVKTRRPGDGETMRGARA